MLEQLSRNWWVLAIRGVAAIAFGISAILWPGLTLAVLVVLYGAYALVDGIFALVAAFRHRMPNWGLLLLEGLVGIGAGVVAFLWPGITAIALLMLVALWSIGTGIFEIATAVRLRKEIEGEWILGLAGLASVALGVILIAYPASGALALVWLIGTFAIASGILFLILGFRLRAFARKFTTPEVRGPIGGVPHPGST